MKKDDFINLFKFYSAKETGLFYDIFTDQKVDVKTITAYYQLYLDAKEIGYKYNAHVLYLPFENATVDLTETEYFIIRNKKEILLQVYFESNYDIQRIEDNLTALYF